MRTTARVLLLCVNEKLLHSFASGLYGVGHADCEKATTPTLLVVPHDSPGSQVAHVEGLGDEDAQRGAGVGERGGHMSRLKARRAPVRVLAAARFASFGQHRSTFFGPRRSRPTVPQCHL